MWHPVRTRFFDIVHEREVEPSEVIFLRREMFERLRRALNSKTRVSE